MDAKLKSQWPTHFIWSSLVFPRTHCAVLTAKLGMQRYADLCEEGRVMPNPPRATPKAPHYTFRRQATTYMVKAGLYTKAPSRSVLRCYAEFPLRRKV